MTSKEKALYLVGIFNRVLSSRITDGQYSAEDALCDSKFCALTVVEEVLKEKPVSPPYWGNVTFHIAEIESLSSDNLKKNADSKN